MHHIQKTHCWPALVGQAVCSRLQQLWPSQLRSQQLWQGFHTSSAQQEKKLDEIIKLHRLTHETPDTVESIWMAYHEQSTTHIATVLGKDEHTILSARASASPLFVLPLAKKPGAFQTLLLQWQPPTRLLFTTLEEFKQWGPQAPPHLTVQLFTELADSHGLVLARGQLMDTALLNAAEGRTLLELTRAFYRDAAAYQMVYAFNHNPQQFNFQQLCRELGVTAGLTPAQQPGSQAS